MRVAWGRRHSEDSFPELCSHTSVYTAFPLPSSSFNGSALSSALSAEQDAAYRRVLSPTEAHFPLHRGAEIKEKRDGKLRA